MTSPGLLTAIAVSLAMAPLHAEGGGVSTAAGITPVEPDTTPADITTARFTTADTARSSLPGPARIRDTCTRDMERPLTAVHGHRTIHLIATG